MNLYLISHTHWDREWYLTFQEYRYRLVFLIDKLLELLGEKEEYKFFMLDGQVILLEDYLEIKPYNKETLEGFIRTGRISIGPWYVLSDMFLVSGEAIIRNLKIGIQMAEMYGRSMKIGYLPDQFGHISQTAQILQGFGIDSAVLWRGIGDYPEAVPSEFLWESPDGSMVLGIHLVNSYSNMVFAENIEESVEKIKVEKEDLSKHSQAGSILLMNGVDHRLPQEHVPIIIDAYSKKYPQDEILHSTLDAYIKAVRMNLTDRKVVSGELRNSKESEILAGTLSARMYLKQANENCQSKLEFFAEPLSAFSWVLGNGYKKDFLDYAWKSLLKNHPHDSICGCSIDAVHKEMMYRFEQLDGLLSQLVLGGMVEVCNSLSTRDDSVQGYCLAVYNPLPWERNEIISAVIEFPIEEEVKKFQVDSNGTSLPFYVEQFEQSVLFDGIKAHNNNVAFKKVDRYHVNIGPVKLVPMGISFLDIVRTTEEDKESLYNLVCDRKCMNPDEGNPAIENEFIRIDFNGNGSFNMLDKITNSLYKGLNCFEDEGDRGDMYIHTRPERDRVVSSYGSSAIISIDSGWVGAIRVKVEQSLFIPESIDNSRDTRCKKQVEMKIISNIVLGHGSRRVDIVTEVINTARDHRLRVLFPSGIKTEFSEAESAFDVVKRNINLLEVTDWVEDPPHEQPQQSFVDVNDGRTGLLIANKGLPEYEVKPDGAIALTLLRSVEWGSRGDLHNCRKQKNPDGTPGMPYMYEPEAQCQGRHKFQYAVVPHSSNWLSSEAWKEAYNHKAKCYSIMLSGIKHPEDLSFFSLDNRNIMVSAVKKSDKEDAIIIRLYNLSNRDEVCPLRSRFEIIEAYYVNFIEERTESIVINSEGSLMLNLKKKEIKTAALILDSKYKKLLFGHS